ncbi:S-adenosyl-L-methionine-dependent methyltransferase [Saccharata proteae CBS 121410]|uniref:S-adenosyl-L-methionine-dependent methyltransferase n=1 Tax=Saccharata proteae CBS 121410 TaxID=1314787 RepID=A0A9P4HLH5_9PEZI|nr:S-adenosyl-L-methionine-dependent methyltransferase [Saccharata proteae CBS 121410]
MICSRIKTRARDMQAVPAIEAEDEEVEGTNGDSESGYESEGFENGRRYHRFRQGQEMKHAMVLAACEDKLHFAPLGKNPVRVVDLGPGVGSWCIDFGDKYPGAHVLGIDLSPHQPQWVPPNVKFMVEDAEDEWLNPEDYFDSINARHMTYAIKDYPKLLSQALKHLKPGAYIEFQELNYRPECDDDSMPKDWRLAEYIGYVRQGLANLGLDLHRAAKLATEVRYAGFVNVEERVIKVPIGSWAKDKLLKTVGSYLQAIILDGFQQGGYGPLCRGLGWSKEKVEIYLSEVRNAAKDSRVHAYYELYIIFGQKPGAAAATMA